MSHQIDERILSSRMSRAKAVRTPQSGPRVVPGLRNSVYENKPIHDSAENTLGNRKAVTNAQRMPATILTIRRTLDGDSA